MSMPQRSIVRSLILPSALAVAPYLAINLGQILIHDGSFIHFSKQEALMLTIGLGFALSVGTAVVLSICAWQTKEGTLLYCSIALAVFSIAATAVEPRFWCRLFDVLNDGLAEWLFRTGALATVLSSISMRWESRLARVR